MNALMLKAKKNLFNQDKVVLYILLGLCLLFSLTTKNFFTIKNLMIVMRQVSTTGILALGMTFLIISGNNDLSAGSTLAFSGVVAATAMGEWHLPIWTGILLACLVSVAITGIIGIVVAKGKIPAFIATLGFQQVIRGIAMIWSDGMPIGNLPERFTNIGSGFVFGIPIPIYIYAATICFAYIFLKKTPLGRYTYAIGGNQEATRLSGVNIDWCKIKIYLIHGVMVALAGIVLAARVKSGQPSIGVGYETEAIAATVIGGTSFSGGVGTVVGAVIGAIIMGIIQNGLDLMNVSSFYQQVIKGSIIVIAVLIDRKRKV